MRNLIFRSMTASLAALGIALIASSAAAAVPSTITHQGRLYDAQNAPVSKAMDIVFTVGREDPFRDNNEHLSDILRGKGVNHAFHLWDERAHQGYYWRRMAQIYV